MKTSRIRGYQETLCRSLLLDYRIGQFTPQHGNTSSFCGEGAAAHWQNAKALVIYLSRSRCNTSASTPLPASFIIATSHPIYELARREQNSLLTMVNTPSRSRALLPESKAIPRSQYNPHARPPHRTRSPRQHNRYPGLVFSLAPPLPSKTAEAEFTKARPPVNPEAAPEARPRYQKAPRAQAGYLRTGG
jgi:hypothetical protein